MPTIAEQQELVRQQIARENLRGFENAPAQARETLRSYGQSPIFNNAPSSSSISSTILLPSPTVPILPKPEDTTNYNALIAHGQGVLGVNVTTPPATSEGSDLNQRLSNLMTSLGTQSPSIESAYQTQYQQTGIEEERKRALAAQAAVRSAQADLEGIQAQIQAVISKRDVQNLQLEKQASGGQVITPILNRQQQEVNRQAAIEALPLQAQALAAQAKLAALQGQSEYAQSTLKMAQDKLDTVFQLKSKDIQNEYEYKKEARKAIFDFLSDEQKTRAAAKQHEENRTFLNQQNNLNNAQAISAKALDSGQGDIAAKITQLDPKSNTFLQDLATLQAQIKPKLTAKTSETTFRDVVISGRLMRIISDKSGKEISRVDLGDAGEVGGKETKNIFQKAQTTIQQYKDQGYTRQQVEDEWKKQNAASGQDSTTVELPLTVQRALDNLYGAALAPTTPAKTFRWYNPLTWF